MYLVCSCLSDPFPHLPDTTTLSVGRYCPIKTMVARQLHTHTHTRTCMHTHAHTHTHTHTHTCTHTHTPYHAHPTELFCRTSHVAYYFRCTRVVSKNGQNWCYQQDLTMQVSIIDCDTLSLKLYKVTYEALYKLKWCHFIGTSYKVKVSQICVESFWQSCNYLGDSKLHSNCLYTAYLQVEEPSYRICSTFCSCFRCCHQYTTKVEPWQQVVL